MRHFAEAHAQLRAGHGKGLLFIVDSSSSAPSSYTPPPVAVKVHPGRASPPLGSCLGFVADCLQKPTVSVRSAVTPPCTWFLQTVSTAAHHRGSLRLYTVIITLVNKNHNLHKDLIMQCLPLCVPLYFYRALSHTFLL